MQVAIVDDSRLARLELKQQISKIPNINVVAEAANVTQAIDMLEKHPIDLLLLDIDLPDGDGFDVLEQANQVPQIIFVTAFNEYAIKSFEYNALDYLMKPVRKERLLKALNKVKVDSQTDEIPSERRIFIKDRDNCYFINQNEIIAFEALGNYTLVHLKNTSPSIYKPIGSIAERLDKQLFFRASRSWVINTQFIESIDLQANGSFKVAMIGNKVVTISKRQAVEFKRTWAF